MSLRDPAERSRIGAQQQTELLGAAPREPRSLLESVRRDYLFASERSECQAPAA